MDNYKEQSGNYKHLDIERRETLALMRAQGISVDKIALEIQCHRSTLYRELKRNSPSVRKVLYRANRAQKMSDKRKQESHVRERLKTEEIRQYVKEKIEQKWSPEQIANRMTLDHPDWKTNYESIYQFVYEEFRQGIDHLRHSHKTRRKRASGKNKRAIRIPNRTMIDQRPPEVEKRDRPGHFEADTMVSRCSKAALMVVVDRCTGIVVLEKLERKTADEMNRALTTRLSRFPADHRLTITYDNGTENALHEKTSEALGTKAYFCRPYHSWEKGPVENTIGLVRQYLPKGFDLSKISEEELMAIETAINNRPRKRFGYLSPLEKSKTFVALCA